MSRLVRLSGSLALAALLMVTLLGSGSRASAQDAMALVRVVHASPDAPAVDVFVNGDRAIEDLAFGEETGLIELPEGTYDVAVVPSGADEGDAVLTATLDLVGGMGYTVAAIGTLDSIEAAVYELDLSPIEAGNSRVRVIHASPDAPAVDIAAVGVGTLIEGLAFPDASAYLEVPAATYDFEVLAAGSDTVALEVPGVALEDGMVYDIMAIGLLGDGSLTVLPLVSEPMAAPAEDGGAPDTGIGSAAAGTGMLMALIAVAAVFFASSGTVLRRANKRA